MRRRRILYAALDGGANWLLLTGVTICALAEKNGVDFACMDDRAERCCGGDFNGLVWAAFDAYQKRRKKSDAVFYIGKHFELFGLRCD